MPVGSDTGVAQDATLQAIILALGGPVVGMPNGSGTGVAQDASLQQILALLGGGSLPGGGFFIRIPIALVTVSSAAFIPLNAVVTRAYIDNSGGAAYSPGTTIEVGIAGTPSLFMGVGDSNPPVQGLYDAMQDTVCTAKAHLLVTILGAPAAGSGFACVEFAAPLS